jgi:hypothetical protein
MRSWSVLMLEPQLMYLPFLAGLAGLAVFGLLGIPALLLSSAYNDPSIVSWALYAALLYLIAFLASFSAAAVAAGALQRLETGRTSVRTAFDAAWERRGQLARWAALSTIVGLVLRAIEERFGFVGAIVARLADAAWAVASAFAIPVILVEDVGPGQAIKRSTAILRARWGEAIGGVVAVDVLLLPWLLLLIFGAVVLLAVGLVGLAIAIFAVGLVAYVVLSAALNAVARALLYRYATTGDPAGLGEDVAGTATFERRRRRRRFGFG